MAKGDAQIVVRGPAKSGKTTLALMLLRMCEAYGIEVELQLEPGEWPRDVARLVPPNTAFACIARERIGKIVIRTEQTSRGA